MNNVTVSLKVADLVPHSERMLLLDSVTDHDENSLTADGVVRADCPLVRDGAVGAWVGIEYMAQAIAAFEGCRAREQGSAPKVGFLIGSRHYTCSVSSFPVGTAFSVHVAQQWTEGGLGLFLGTLTGENFRADASISVFLPEDASQYLSEATE